MKMPRVKQCRYLGITISTQNSDIDLKRQMRKLYANVNLLLRKFSKCSVGVKCFLFKTYCSNLYCAPMWFDCTKAALKKLKIAYNNSLRDLCSYHGVIVPLRCLQILASILLMKCSEFLFLAFVSG